MKHLLACSLCALLFACAGQQTATSTRSQQASRPEPAQAADSDTSGEPPSDAPPPAAPPAPIKSVLTIPEGTRARPIQLRKVIAKINRGDNVGQQKGGLLCVPHGPLTWQGGHALAGEDEFTSAFQDALRQANYPVVGSTDNLFPDPSESRAELMVGGLIDKLNLNACFTRGGFGNTSAVKGSSSLHVKWEVYDVLARKVVYEISTDGHFVTHGSTQGGLLMLMTSAFNDAVRGLLSDQGFYDLVTRDSGHPGAPPPTTFAPLHVNAPAASSDSIASARAASVTVLVGAGGHGSGFIISPDGYVITNQHVVQEAQRVRVRLADESEVIGDVLRTDSYGDVALIKLQADKLPSVHLRNSKPEVGEEVFAIGAPLLEKLDVTVTRGIVSAYRVDRGHNYIQSDVVVHPGNSGGPLTDRSGSVIGVCDWGIQLGGLDQNLNFFIPISEALSRLNLDFNPAPSQLAGHLR